MTHRGYSYIISPINRKRKDTMQTETKILESKVELMTRINKLLQLMNTMQDNIGTLATRLVKLEEKVNKNESK